MDREQKQKRYDELYQKTKNNSWSATPEENREQVELFYELSGEEPVDFGNIEVEGVGSDGSTFVFRPDGSGTIFHPRREKKAKD